MISPGYHAAALLQDQVPKQGAHAQRFCLSLFGYRAPEDSEKSTVTTSSLRQPRGPEDEPHLRLLHGDEAEEAAAHVVQVQSGEKVPSFEVQSTFHMVL